jgi:hypothetical protein
MFYRYRSSPTVSAAHNQRIRTIAPWRVIRAVRFYVPEADRALSSAIRRAAASPLRPYLHSPQSSLFLDIFHRHDRVGLRPKRKSKGSDSCFDDWALSC